MKAKKWVAIRRSSQVFFFLLFTAILWSTTYPLKGGPVPPETVFRLDPLLIFITSLSERVLLPGIILSSVMILLTLILGRFFCGWVCPLGAAFDLAGLAVRKRDKENEKVNAKNRKYKYFILSAVVLSALFGIQAAWVLDPLGIMSRFLSLSFIPSVSSAMRVQFNNMFINAQFMSILFMVAAASVLIKKRFWCRTICPLGAIYALTAKAALLRRVVRGCSDCGACAANCRMGAIRDDFSYSKGECILCMDCVYDCPAAGTSFAFRGNSDASLTGTDASRRNILILISSSVLLSGFGRFRRLGRSRAVIRPPAALPEDEFVDRCIRCGNCMRVCITNGLQPAMGESGVSGIWTPKLVPEIGYCEYNCTLCGNTCPTGAIRRVSLAQKHDTKLGLAVVDRERCISWADGKQCMVCEEHCPVPQKAIKAVEETVNGKAIRKPVVDGNLCVGCGICQNKCPVDPVRAIRVRPF